MIRPEDVGKMVLIVACPLSGGGSVDWVNMSRMGRIWVLRAYGYDLLVSPLKSCTHGLLSTGDGAGPTPNRLVCPMCEETLFTCPHCLKSPVLHRSVSVDYGVSVDNSEPLRPSK